MRGIKGIHDAAQDRSDGAQEFSAAMKSADHSRHSPIGVGAQSTLGGTTFLPEKYVSKINKMPEFCMIPAPQKYQTTRIFVIFARKINKIPEFYMILPEKCPNVTQ